MVATAVGGLDLGLFGRSAIDLSDATGALVGDASDVVMSADAVDELPLPVARTAPSYPAGARSKGITGAVTLSIQVDAQGRVTDVRVLKSEPAGTFDDAAVRAVRGWRFQPATYQGQPVAVRVEQRLAFDLERK
jgi:protein TonB